MIIINKSGYLKYKDIKFKCALGKSGIGKKRTEGDNITPKGNFKIIKIYYRKDRITKINSAFKLIEIKKNTKKIYYPHKKFKYYPTSIWSRYSK